MVSPKEYLQEKEMEVGRVKFKQASRECLFKLAHASEEACPQQREQQGGSFEA